eukprot:3538285-Rhodomonas_salina.1
MKTPFPYFPQHPTRGKCGWLPRGLSPASAFHFRAIASWEHEPRLECWRGHSGGLGHSGGVGAKRRSKRIAGA